MTVTQLEGFDDLERALLELPKATGKNVLRRVLREAGQIMDDAWRARAPVGKTRQLVESGGVGTKLSTRQARFAKRYDEKSYAEMYVGPGSMKRAIQQEFGNAEHPPQPYMRPAWDATQDQILETIGTKLGEEIAAAAARVAKKKARAAAKGG